MNSLSAMYTYTSRNENGKDSHLFCGEKYLVLGEVSQGFDCLGIPLSGSDFSPLVRDRMCAPVSLLKKMNLEP